MTNNSRIIDKDGRERTAKSQQMDGFTLIELLVVIAIIGILAAMGIISYMGVQKQARDASRQSDLKQYQTLLGEFAGKNKGLYPAYSSGVTICTLATTLSTTCFDDPRVLVDPFPHYYYRTDGTLNDGTAVATTYYIYSDLEKDGAGTGYWVLCSEGKVGIRASAPSTSACPL